MGCRVDLCPAHRAGRQDRPVDLLRAPRPPADRPPTAREVRDADLKPKVAQAYVENYGVYGARKVWLTLNRERPGGAVRRRSRAAPSSD